MGKINFKNLINAAAESEDQTQINTFSGASLATEGKTVGRFVEYIELGDQPRQFAGKKKDPAAQVQLAFELLGPKNRKEITVNGETKVIYERIYLRNLSKTFNDKSNYVKLFNKMRYDRPEIKHMAQMLGEAFVITVVHNKSDDGKKTYANISGKGGDWYIEPPFNEDAMTGKRTNYKVAEPSSLRIFLFNHPTPETWDSLFIDGEVEEKDEKGKTKTRSKNFIQETILKATNFPGSALEEMLAGGINIPEDSEEEFVDETEEEVEELEEESEEEVLDEELEETDDAEDEEAEDDSELEAEEESAPPPKAFPKGKKPVASTKVKAAPVKAPAKKATPVATKVAKPTTKAPAKTAVPVKAAKAPVKAKAKTVEASDPFTALGLSD